MLYKNIESAISVNNFIASFFYITRSVKQECPLSMILFIIYQEPFYAALRKSSNVKPAILPDYSIIKAVGHADDTNIAVSSEGSLVEVEKFVSNFESSTNSKVSKNEKIKDIWYG